MNYTYLSTVYSACLLLCFRYILPLQAVDMWRLHRDSALLSCRTCLQGLESLSLEVGNNQQGRPSRCVPDRGVPGRLSLYAASLGQCVRWTLRPWLMCPTLATSRNLDFYPVGHSGNPSRSSNPALCIQWSSMPGLRPLQSRPNLYQHNVSSRPARYGSYQDASSKVNAIQGMYLSSKGHIVQGIHRPRDTSFKGQSSKGHIVQGTYHPRDTSSKRRIVQRKTYGDSSVGTV